MPSAPPNQRPTQGRSENSEAGTVPSCSLRPEPLVCSWSPTTFGGWKVSSSLTPLPISPGPAESIRPSKSIGASEVQVRRCSSGITEANVLVDNAHPYGVDEDGGSPIVGSARREPWGPPSPQANRTAEQTRYRVEPTPSRRRGSGCVGRVFDDPGVGEPGWRRTLLSRSLLFSYVEPLQHSL